MSHTSPLEHRVLHAVRTMGYAATARVAARTHAPVDLVAERLLDAEAHGWVTLTSFAGDAGWSLTESGKAHGELLLAAELDATGARAEVEAAHREFLRHNDPVAAACTAWQLADLGVGERTPSVAATTAALQAPAAALAGIERRLTAHLARFSGYHERFTSALGRARAEPAWITATDCDSCHRVWFELHEDLIATLGLSR
ncbi:hypothetical protein [Cellulomonas sp. SLBN-39]|uniref:hypothetical protein n=1 Tax=Cellulomonas sp. SLBN-39 TaxID=2768446 RepID=UPI001153A3DB|nr:hypothetical protein [Cellulomonas sp. SLBN-39]TQL03587.1 hypothetical protein FBY24_2688 [Cellulomonas sp. SLBN-39]